MNERIKNRVRIRMHKRMRFIISLGGGAVRMDANWAHDCTREGRAADGGDGGDGGERAGVRGGASTCMRGR